MDVPHTAAWVTEKLRPFILVTIIVVIRAVTHSRFWVIRLLNRRHSAEFPACLLCHFLQIDRVGFKLYFQAFSYCVENCRQVIHARIALG
jgi:hypothetical protein